MANPTMTLIASNTVGSGGVSSVTFSSIPATYTDLLLRESCRSPNAGSVFDFDSLSINGSTTGFSGKYLQGNGSTTSSGPSNPGAVMPGATATANVFSNTDWYFPNYTSANNKSFSIDNVMENNATTSYSQFVAMLWSNTAAITSLTLTCTNNFVQYSTFYLYGIKNS